jgi:antitoxin ParD1/3/4
MASRNVVLSEAEAKLVDRLVETNRYKNASAVILTALRLLEREEARLSDLRERLKTGLEEARSGDLADGSGREAIRSAFVFARLQARY